MADQIGAKYVAVRGRLKKEFIDGAYDFRQPYLKYSLSSFEVDADSLEAAFELQARGGPPGIPALPVK
jgi:hypothetical protein